jgi:hypothetical protein
MRNLKKTLRKKRTKNITFRKTRARKTRARKTRARKAGMFTSPSGEARLERQATLAIKRAANLEKQKILLAIAHEKAETQKAKRDAALAIAKTSGKAKTFKSSDRNTPFYKKKYDPQNPIVINSIWYKFFDKPLKEIADAVKKDPKNQDFSTRRMNTAIQQHVLQAFNVIFKNHAHGSQSYSLNNKMSSIYFKTNMAAVLIHYYNRLLNRGTPIPIKAIQRLKAYKADPNNHDMNSLTLEEREMLDRILQQPPVNDDSYLLTDEDIEEFEHQYPTYNGLLLTDEDLVD